ncbi:MAG: coproporphyrinogen dehydrogenase HemZ [Clostridiales Family XIII bacterium]|jgi:oxygen-independent coproporphyrinogen-3 oxidase|nr:coproporphyrinogen dehydrogenase HemZ [Clostridiales Family XIII bacterium]
MTQTFRIGNIENSNEYEELIRMFLPPSAFEISKDGLPLAASKDEIKRVLYTMLSEETGHTLDWGILTGVKPLKLYDKLVREYGSVEAAEQRLADFYLLSPVKIHLLHEIYSRQQQVLSLPRKGDVGVYLGIPFCPTRCAYCSFTSNPASPQDIKKYLEALNREICYVSEEMTKTGMQAESIYIGGGTPTTLLPEQLAALLSQLKRSLPHRVDAEWTVEAGRPDTLTVEMAQVLAEAKVRRISINPQTMNPLTLERIGRAHDVASVYEAYQTARKVGIPIINTDLIAGLPGETAADFTATLDAIYALSPENITVHTLSVKKGSRLRDENAELCYNEDGRAANMLCGLTERMKENGYSPYYIYRQKQMLDNLENCGYTKPGSACVYNIRIMEERQTIVAMGAGGSSKVYFPSEDRIERVFNVSNWEIYCDRIEEMLARKSHGLFMPLSFHSEISQ